MPVVKFKHVVSFSSEDRVYKASNLLLGGNSVQKWKCEKAGERQASVILQLQKAIQIKSIDIGNEGSAFIEILVSRSSDAENYQVILVASAFTSPVDSRNGVGLNRVRMFDKDKLSQTVSSEKWDRVKVVCTQPFNKHTTYGLSFIKVYTHEEEETLTTDVSPEASMQTSEKETKTFGMFKLKSESNGQTASPSAFKIKQALPKVEEPTRKRKIGPVQQNTKTQATPQVATIKKEFKKENDTPKKRKIEQKTILTPKPAVFKKDTPIKQAPTFTKAVKTETKPTTTKTKTAKKSNVPYNEILEGVVIALSGFQNPKRGEIRDKAIRMGALYRRDWDSTCTHLICAFRNTPKFAKVVNENGNVVDSKWIQDCAQQKKLISWKKYNWNPKMNFNSESESEDENNLKEDSDTDDIIEDKLTTTASKNIYDESTDEDTDTENQLYMGSKVEPTKDVDPYDVSTDEETNGNDNTDLPSYFNDVRFMLVGDFPLGVERLLTRHIITCGGIIEKYMSDDVEIVITENSWDSTFDDAIANNSAIMFIKPMWVFECSKAKQRISYDKYTIKD